MKQKEKENNLAKEQNLWNEIFIANQKKEKKKIILTLRNLSS